MKRGVSIAAVLITCTAGSMMAQRRGGGPGPVNPFLGNEPAVRGWALVQEGPTVTYEKDVTLGDIIPSTIKLAEIPNFPKYGFVILNTERVIVAADTRKVIAVY